jgi:hypothetical protein
MFNIARLICLLRNVPSLASLLGVKYGLVVLKHLQGLAKI